MSPSVKLGLLTLVSAVAAVPHYGHSRFHKPSGGYQGTGTGAPFPTGGYGNATVLPSGTGVSPEKTTTLLETQYSTETIVSTIYATRPGGVSSVEPEDVSTGAAGCGPETVYVTATNKVTVTVTGGYPSGSASAAPSSVYSSFVAEIPSDLPSSEAAPESSAAPSSKAPGGGYEASSVSFVLPSVTLSMPNKPVDTPGPTPEEHTSAAPVSSVAASSSASAPEPSSPVYSGGKRGLAYNEGSLCDAFDSSKFSFAYNWGATQYGSKLPAGIKYSPMMHKPQDMSADEWLGHVDDNVASGSDLIMGFNEPDHPDQANLSPDAACTAWTEYMDPVKAAHGDVTILGPSVTNGPAPMGLSWLEGFQQKCPDAKWDATNIHFYDIYDNGAGVQRFIDHVEEAAEKFGKKVFVTEYGLRSGSDDEAIKFLQETMKYLEGSDKVSGYSYFMVGQGPMQLNTANGLSAIGEVYNS
ncbi:hypothetical protein EJ04DRAFT_515043 [Polyplosphaeria fusca]|uniref:Asl1-like glycosyl hydrolase catalytic domain-containing protein n=1 Tax=Polyplosphaeria fusca TaxID=682080 RepID=A0A9P4QSV5_9PLEO|nr:hypothetical protein EJ04DRAFT_515043 [Polyplosphaeria fusca]